MYPHFSLKMKAAGLAALMSSCLRPLAQPIPLAQRDVESNEVSTTSHNFVLVPNTSVAVNNGDVARECIIHLSSNAVVNQDTGVTDINDGIDVAFAIGAATVGAGACSVSGGPEFFYMQSSGVGGSATVMHVRNVGSGTRTIKACYRLFEPQADGSIARLFRRAMTVECRTQ